MTRIELPLAFRRLQTTGDVLLHAELELAIKSDQGTWATVLFVVDPGTEMTTMPAGEARKWNLPIPKRPVRGLTLQGQEVRSGLLRVRIPAMDLTEYVFPCFFVGDPDTPPPPTAKNLLGLTGVINQIRLTFDGATAPGVPYGVLIVEKR
jgi:hypothetical protein